MCVSVGVVGCVWRYKVDEVVTRSTLRRGALDHRSSRRFLFGSDGHCDLLPVPKVSDRD